MFNKFLNKAQDMKALSQYRKYTKDININNKEHILLLLLKPLEHTVTSGINTNFTFIHGKYNIQKEGYSEKYTIKTYTTYNFKRKAGRDVKIETYIELMLPTNLVNVSIVATIEGDNKTDVDYIVREFNKPINTAIELIPNYLSNIICTKFKQYLGDSIDADLMFYKYKRFDLQSFATILSNVVGSCAYIDFGCNTVIYNNHYNLVNSKGVLDTYRFGGGSKMYQKDIGLDFKIENNSIIKEIKTNNIDIITIPKDGTPLNGTQDIMKFLNILAKNIYDYKPQKFEYVKR